MTNATNVYPERVTRRHAPLTARHALRTLCLSTLASLAIGALTPAQAQTPRTGVSVTVPNGYANVTVDDMRVSSTAGVVRWVRQWDGQEWKLNPQWESLSQSWKNLTGSQSADTTGSTAAASSATTAAGPAPSADSGCWVWVDEDWQPSTETVKEGAPPGDYEAGPMVPIRTTPFNRVMAVVGDGGDYTVFQRISLDYATLCAGSSRTASASDTQDTEGVRRINELYLGQGGRYAFNNRSILEKRPVRQWPVASAAALYASLARGNIAPAPVNNPKGYRWIDKSGDWIDYSTQSQVVAWGDRNDNIVWLARDTDGIVRGVVDANGHVLYSLHYTGELVTEVKDYPLSGSELPARSVKYQYDVKNRLTQVTDVRGNPTAYDYDKANRIVQLTDPESHAEQLAYVSNVVVKRTAPDGTVTDYAFDYDDTNKQFVSKITGPEAAAGRRVEDLTHNRVGKLVRRLVNGRTDDEISYDTGARAETRVNARGFATRTTKNEFDQVVEVAQPDGTAIKRSYSAQHLGLTEEVDELGIKTQYQYDPKGNPLKRIEAVGTTEERTAEAVVNSLGQYTQVTRKGRTEANGTVTPDATWRVEYDPTGQISKVTDPEGNARQYAYDRAGNLARYTDPRGNATSYEADADGNLIKATDALGRATQYQYDKVGNLLTQTDARGKAIRASYDTRNRWVQGINPVGGVYKIQYNAQGVPIAETDEDGRTQRAEFDNFLRITKQIDGRGNTTEYNYNIADGSSTGALGGLYDPTETKYPTFTERKRYDALERPTNETLLNPNSLGVEGLVSTAVYDKRGQVTSETDANGKTRFNSWNALGQFAQSTDSLGNKTSARYDGRGNLIEITDAKGNANKFEFDRNDRIAKEILPLGQTTSYQYDAAGNLSNRTDPNGHTTAYAYDAANRLTQVKHYKAGTALQRTTTYTWDAVDNLTAWSNTDQSIAALGLLSTSGTATFDDANRKTGETVTYPAGNILGYAYAYSAAGYKTKLVWPDGTAIDYAYSAHGELESIAIPGEGSISVNEFKWFAPSKVTLPGGSTQERTLDGLLNLEGLKVKTPGQQTVLNVANTYGKVQELKTNTRTDSPGSASSTKSSSFTYDDETRLTQSTVDSGGAFGTDTESFKLDAVGNRVAHSKVSGAWTYDNNNRLTQRGTGAAATTYQYDDAGNLTNKTEPGDKVTQFGYDTQNRLVEVKDGNGNLIARYGYDPMDRRLWKEQYRNKDGSLLATAQRLFYLYADEGLIGEATQGITLNADQSVTATTDPAITTQYGPRPEAEFTTGVLFLKTKNSNGQDSVAYYHHDQIGAPIQATDKAGNVVWAGNYNVFGQVNITTPAATADKPTIASNLRLPGQIEDAETGLHYNYRRYYDPSTGRYVTQDPIGMAGGGNRYRYSEADPLNLSDPTGECPMCVAYAACVAQCVLEDVAVNAITGECNNFGDSAKSCATSCLLGPLGRLAKWFGRAKKPLQCALSNAPNSFPGETLVHVKPKNAKSSDAQKAKATLQPIGKIQVGDEVLALSEWKSKGMKPGADARLSYERVTDALQSYKAETLVHITLDDGTTLTATSNHALKTSEGWRDAIQLTKGGQLLLKGGRAQHWLTDEPAENSEEDTKSEQVKRVQGAPQNVAYESQAIQAKEEREETLALISDVRTEVKKLLVFNLEVANAHTFFAGRDGVLVHNGFGSYTCVFTNGMKYHGKGNYKRFSDSIKRIERDFNTKVDKFKSDWKTAISDKQSFKDEAARIAKDGGIGKGAPGTNYNMINSPGK